MQKRIQTYKMVVGQTHEELEKNVNEAIKKGFEPYGDPSIQSDETPHVFCQAMVLRRDF
ncbi:DUF1737 domain-containing protein [Verrucomicrobia bacterium]|nr:DUF1737 domain-containing protein [Verrucomicrobiota bacterium]MDC0267973.1 DUF1737 domain-containing protein [bacterium]MDG1889664.1 DUF1737 domain-containing protein [Verrucomicrobiota bacterium]